MIKNIENSWIISDTHLGHMNINKYEPIRIDIANKNNYSNPFNYIMDKWNEKIKSDDEILHLGDFCWKKESIEELSKKLNGKKTILLGNHDHTRNEFNKYGWNTINELIFNIKDEINIIEDKYIKGFNSYIADAFGYRLFFSHEPLFVDEFTGDNKAKVLMKVYNDVFLKYHCDFNIHGHIHSRVIDDPKFINTSVEHTNLEPIRLKDLIDRHLNKEIN